MLKYVYQASKRKGEKKMAKKLLIIAALMLALALALASCGDEGNSSASENSHMYHDFGEWITSTSPTCTEEGLEVCYCTGCDFKQEQTIPATGHSYGYYSSWNTVTEATCASKGLEEYVCPICETVTETRETDILSNHDFGGEETNGNCTVCGYGVNFILPELPREVVSKNYNGSIEKKCKILSIKIESEYNYSRRDYKLTFLVESTYHEKGDSYSSYGEFGWKLYDEEGLVVTSGTGYTDATIAVGEKSKEIIKFRVGEDSDELKMGKTYRFEILNLS